MVYLMMAAVLLLDQLAKYAVAAQMELYESIPVIEGIFHITYIQNFGAAFSILQNRQIFLQIVTGCVILCCFGYLVWKRRSLPRLTAVSLALLVSGGAGNFLDRVLYGYVVDFFDFRIWPVFNVADIAVCIGCMLLVLSILRAERHQEEQQTQDGAAPEQGEAGQK